MLRPDTLALTGLLALLTAFAPVATDIYVPSMPDIARVLNASASDVQLTLSSYLVGFAVGQIIYGPLSDRYGRKPVLLLALALFCVASLACAVAPEIWTLIAARALQALGGAGAIVLSRAIVRDLYVGERAARELSRMGAIMSFAPVLAPLLGGIVQTGIGWRANFVIVFAVGLTGAAITWRSLPETLTRRAAEPVSIPTIMRDFRAIAGDRSFVANLAILTCTYAGMFAWISGSAFVLQDLYGLSAFAFGVAFSVACIGVIGGAAAAAPLVMRIGLDLTIGLGVVLLSLGGLAMLASVALGWSPVVGLVSSMAVYYAGLMLTMPQAMAAALTPFAERAGSASSLIGFVQQTSAAALGILVGRVLGESAWPLALAITAMGGLSLLVWAGSRRVRRQAVQLGETTLLRNSITGIPRDSVP